jgi:nucleotide-binding universal stress UspA family protein
MTDRPSSIARDRTNIATVLVPTDFSAESLKALRYAAGLVEKFGAKLHVVHVSKADFDVPGPRPNRRDRPPTIKCGNL